MALETTSVPPFEAQGSHKEAHSAVETSCSYPPNAVPPLDAKELDKTANKKLLSNLLESAAQLIISRA